MYLICILSKHKIMFPYGFFNHPYILNVIHPPSPSTDKGGGLCYVLLYSTYVLLSPSPRYNTWSLFTFLVSAQIQLPN